MTVTAEPAPAVGDVLENALDGERISDDDAEAKWPSYGPHVPCSASCLATPRWMPASSIT